MRFTHAFAIAAALFAAGFSFAGEGAVGNIPWKLPRYTLVARDMDLRMALDSFAVSEGLSVVMSDQVAGRFSGDFKDVPPAEFLEKIATVHNLMWYYDGAALYVCGAGEIRTLLIDLKYMKAGELAKLLGELGVEDVRFPLRTASNDELVMVSGPPRYVALVSETIAKADRLREMRTVSEIETRVFPLVHTWADNVSFSVSSPESTATIRGVARLLEEIMNGGGSQALDVSITNSVSALEAAQMSTFNPVIRPENRINAVIVRDAAVKMPMYEKLIRELDVPQKLVEIDVTIVELSREDALDWQLSLAAAGRRGHSDGSVGQNAQNIFAPAELAGQGLAGSMTHIHSAYSIAASLSALRSKGKARNISRTALLTVNNLAAEMTDSQSYHARIVGTEVATLEEVSAGTKLQIKPRIVAASRGGAATNKVWLSMRLDDGGFQTVTVDSMPMTRSSTLQTQTSVYEGDSIMLAGYLRDIEESGGWGIPYLRDIPWIGWIFGGASVKKETVQRMFLITPHVVDLDEEMLARLQATRLRDVVEEEKIADDAEDSDVERRLRELERDEAGRRRRERYDNRYERRKAEIEHLREVRKLGQRFTDEKLKEDKKTWEEQEDIAMKAATAVFEGTEILRVKDSKKEAEKNSD